MAQTDLKPKLGDKYKFAAFASRGHIHSKSDSLLIRLATTISNRNNGLNFNLFSTKT